MIDHSGCVDGQDNPDCPSGLHTRVPLLQMGAMFARKAAALRNARAQAADDQTSESEPG